MKIEFIRNTFPPKFFRNIRRNLVPFSSSLSNLHISANLVGPHNIANHEFRNIVSNGVITHQQLLDLHNRLVNFLTYYLINTVFCGGVIRPKYDVLGSDPFFVYNNSIYLDKSLIDLVTSDEKRVISSVYGEALVSLMLMSLNGVSAHGVLKVNSSNISSPDFLVVNNRRRILLVTEVKSSINNAMNDVTRQKRGYKRGLGVNVIFNSHLINRKPAIVRISDPHYSIKGLNLWSSVIFNMALIDTVQIINSNLINFRNVNSAEIVLEQYRHQIIIDSTKPINLEYSTENNQINFLEDKVNNFFDVYLNMPPQKNTGYLGIYKVSE
ncbi:hypothetical protein [Sutcliffiella horikoshii]|uniref:Uncharacterized protein n=1 Tax=Sutcliffiella horikoshii TaxID=79883 RepID=A0A5D4SVL9_9BACI|nr:hypothetical protein [Sutcliffiella horikoshii]TYS67345.1 hypothetical protein FZC75_19065 [Sutcliffiella horikoshii]